MSSRISPDDLVLGLRLVRDLPALLRRCLDVDEARRRLAERFAQREAAFLGLVRDGVYGHPPSPYRPLLQQAGCAVPRYAVMECGAIGLACLRPCAPDEVHLLHDARAVIQPDWVAEADTRPAPLFLTSLGPTAPFVLLNVSMGDEAVVDTRACGCPLEALGWTTHLRAVRSPEKLTAGGMSFLDADVVRVLEEHLPRRFGGGPTDYQLVEDEDAQGRPLLVLVVAPTVGPLDPGDVVQAFLEGVSAGPAAERVMALLWRDAGFLRVERRRPTVTPSGKILHLHAAGARPPDRSG